MASETNDSRVEYTPDFILSHRDVVREDNWREWEAKGFFVTMTVDDPKNYLFEELDRAKDIYGIENVYTGDAWSYESQRPLFHKPGVSIYIHPDGKANVAKWRAKHFPDEHHASSPAAS